MKNNVQMRPLNNLERITKLTKNPKSKLIWMKILKIKMTNVKQNHYPIERTQTTTQSRMIRKLP